MSFYPPPGSQSHSVYSLPSVTGYPASSYYPSRRSRRYSTSSFSSYPPVLAGNANYGLNSYPYWYGQGYSGVPTMASAYHQTQLPYFGNPYISPSRTVIHPGTTHYGYQGYYPTQGSQFGQPQTIIVKSDGGGRRHRRHRRRSSSY